jgi:hypothetical protein
MEKLPYQGIVIEIIAPSCFKEGIAGRLIAAEEQLAPADMVPKGQGSTVQDLKIYR